MRGITSFVAAACASGVVLAALPARGNDGTPPALHDVIQQGQDVRLTLGIVVGGEPGFDDAYTLLRSSAAESTTVFEQKVFTEDEVVSSEGRCRLGGGDPATCETSPELCSDCDDDGVPECDVSEDGWCETVNTVRVVDVCVPAGRAEYTLTAEGWGAFERGESIDVTDEGGCPADSIDSDSGCSLSGSPRSALPLTAALLVVGLVARLSSRRR